MGFMQDRVTEARDAVSNGDPERAADIVVHALLEGGGTFEENLAEMTEDPS